MNMPRTIGRNQSRVIAGLKAELTICQIHSLAGDFRGRPCDPAQAWDALAKHPRAKLSDCGDGQYTIRVHSNLWYRLTAPDAAQVIAALAQVAGLHNARPGTGDGGRVLVRFDLDADMQGGVGAQAGGWLVALGWRLTDDATGEPGRETIRAGSARCASSRIAATVAELAARARARRAAAGARRG
jgi:hypothetical protein